jgi:hypothetical protein
MKTKRQDSRATLALYIAAALLLLFIGGTIARGFALGNKALIDVKNDFINAVSGVR